MQQLRRDGVALAYEEAGSGAPPLVLVHDFASDHTSLATQFAHFSRCHRVVAVDLRGHGHSDRSDQGYMLSLLADDLAWLCYELGLYLPVVLGVGLGGMVALDLAARYPDLPAALVVVAPAAAYPALPDTLPQHPAAQLRESVFNWDCGAARIVPVLRIASSAGEATLPRGISTPIDCFITELAGRAPPDLGG